MENRITIPSGFMYDERNLGAALSYIAEKQFDYIDKRIFLDIEFLCKVKEEDIERNFPKVSFRKNPLKNLRNNFYRGFYNRAVNNLVSNLECEDKFAEYITFSYLKTAKENIHNSVEFPRVIEDKLSSYPKDYLSNLKASLSK